MLCLFQQVFVIYVIIIKNRFKGFEIFKLYNYRVIICFGGLFKNMIIYIMEMCFDLLSYIF